jgi:hypothetical protein
VLFEGMRNYKSSEEKEFGPLLGHRFLVLMPRPPPAWNKKKRVLLYRRRDATLCHVHMPL